MEETKELQKEIEDLVNQLGEANERIEELESFIDDLKNSLRYL